jgi:hypothetical protein
MRTNQAGEFQMSIRTLATAASMALAIVLGAGVLQVSEAKQVSGMQEPLGTLQLTLTDPPLPAPGTEAGIVPPAAPQDNQGAPLLQDLELDQSLRPAGIHGGDAGLYLAHEIVPLG